MISLKEIEEKKKEIVEKYGLFMEKNEDFPPIAARIFSTLLFTSKKGNTFEELVNFLDASKSTISTNLQKLKSMEIVDYYTKPGERKKYFRLSPVGFLAFIDRNLKKLKDERDIIEEVIAFKSSANKVIKEASQQFVVHDEHPYLDYLNNSISDMETLKKRIIAKCMNQ
ncbi:GbsR/MarR family transcriptional regulator [Marinifilum sp.]|uniref:GbsR/MarR family transcriptional regulator n=1 Tax=Marinifilum sp. TaxID=2033137 RepID=UPI003BACA140